MDLVTLALAKSYINKKINEGEIVTGATPQQAAQIEQNKADIADLQTEVDELKESGGGSVDLTGIVRSVNGKTPDEKGNVEIDVSSSGQNATWDELEGKPTYVQTGPRVVEWNGAMDGDQFKIVEPDATVTTWLKVSDEIPGKEELIGAAFDTNSDYLYPGPISAINDGVGCYGSSDHGILVVTQAGEIENPYGRDGIAPSTGIYVTLRAYEDETSPYMRLAYGSYSQEKLLPQWLPDGGFGWEAPGGKIDILPETELVVDDATETIPTPDGGTLYGYLFHPMALALVDGKEYQITIDGVAYQQKCALYDYNGRPIYYLGNLALSGAGEDTGEDWLFLIQEDGSDYWIGMFGTTNTEYKTVAISGQGTVVHQIFDKFIPASVARKDDIKWERIPDKPFGVTVTSLASPMTLAEMRYNGSYTYGLGFLPQRVTAGERYLVSVDGEITEWVAQQGDGGVYLGTDPMTFTGGGEIADGAYSIYDTGHSILVFLVGEQTQPVIGVAHVEIKYIDERVIPESIARKTDIPEIPDVVTVPAIINVEELPTENIREGCFYRLDGDIWTYDNNWFKMVFASESPLKPTITWDGDMTGKPALDMSNMGYSNGVYMVKVTDNPYTVEELLGCTVNLVREQSQYNSSFTVTRDIIDTDSYPGAFVVSNYIAVVYSEEELAAALKIPTGIYPNGTYFWTYVGDAYPDDRGHTDSIVWPTIIKKIPDKYLDVNTSSGSAGGGIIDVAELPTENIQSDALYCVVSAKLMMGKNDAPAFTCYCVDSLPEAGLPATNADNSDNNVYYNVSDGGIYGYIDDALSASMSISVGWHDGGMLIGRLGYEYAGVITDIREAPADHIFRLLAQYEYYRYQRETWVKVIVTTEYGKEYNIIWDGDTTGHTVVDLGMIIPDMEGMRLVKVSDEVPTFDELRNGYVVYGYTHPYNIMYTLPIQVLIDDGFDGTDRYPGCMTLSSIVAIIHDADLLCSALGAPAGMVTNGTYFFEVDVGDDAEFKGMRMITTKLISGCHAKNGIYPDFNQNDADNPGYIQNRTHWREKSTIPTVIEWDGNTDGLTSIISSNGINLYKISDLTPAYEELFGGAIGYIDKNSNIIYHDTITESYSLEQQWQITDSALMTFNDVTMFIVYKPNTPITIMADTFVFPSTGIYVESDNNDEFRKLEYYSYVYHKLDKRYLPDDYGVAPPVPENPDTSNPVSLDWNDIQNRPFGTETGTHVVEWDGDIAGRELVSVTSDVLGVKVSDEVPDTNSVVSGLVKANNGESMTFDSTDIDLPQDGVLITDDFLIFEKETVAPGDIAIRRGIYFPYNVKTGAHISRLEYIGDVHKKLDDKFISDDVVRCYERAAMYQGFFNKTVNIFPMTFDGVTSYCGYFDAPVNMQNPIVGKEYRFWLDGVDYHGVCEESHGGGITIHATDNPSIRISIATNSSSRPVTVQNTQSGTVNVILIGELDAELVQLDEKYIPDTIARKTDILQGGVTSYNDLTDKPCYITDKWTEKLKYVYQYASVPDNDYWDLIIPKDFEFIVGTTYKITIQDDNYLSSSGLGALECLCTCENIVILGNTVLVLSRKSGSSQIEFGSITGNSMVIRFNFQVTPMTSKSLTICVYEADEPCTFIEERYIVPSIARVADIPKVPTKLSELEQDANYNNLIDKPFYLQYNNELVLSREVTLSSGNGSVMFINTIPVDGEEYKVTVGSQVYTCICSDGRLQNPNNSKVYVTFTADTVGYTMYVATGLFGYADTITVRVEKINTELKRMDEMFLPESVGSVVIRSSTEGSAKKFRLTIDDFGTLTVSEIITEEVE